MVRFEEAECPNCGADLKLSEDMVKATCLHCGSSFIIATDDLEVSATGNKIQCPRCKGSGNARCFGVQSAELKYNLIKYELFAESCVGDGKCHVIGYPQKEGISINYCVRGKCAWCNGSGRIRLRKCEFCNGTGNCRFCGGSGTCILCGGTEVRECPSCQGKGYNIYYGE